jgi:chromate transport protein ChrA
MQSITAIGYHMDGLVLAILTFFVWVLSAILAVGTIGVLFAQIGSESDWKPATGYLPAAADFIIWRRNKAYAQDNP